MTLLTTLFLLLIVFQMKHLLADFFWQNSYMLGKFKDEGWVKPLAAHCSVHGVLTAIIVMSVTLNPLLTILLVSADVILHFCIDRAKVISSRGITYENPKFWHNIGIDQLLHHITHYAFIMLMLKEMFPFIMIW